MTFLPVLNIALTSNETRLVSRDWTPPKSLSLLTHRHDGPPIHQVKDLNLAHYDKLDLGALPAFSGLISLNISNGQLKQIPAQIFALRMLQQLFLAGNKLEVIPPVISQLQYLEILDLRNNAIRLIPEEIFRLPSLRVLRLAGNGISYATCWPRLVDLISRRELPLTELDLSHNNINNWPESLSRSLARLKKLNLSFNEYHFI